MTLNELKVGQSGTISAVGGDGALPAVGYGADAQDLRDAAEGGAHGRSHRDPRAGL